MAGESLFESGVPHTLAFSFRYELVLCALGTKEVTAVALASPVDRDMHGGKTTDPRYDRRMAMDYPEFGRAPYSLQMLERTLIHEELEIFKSSNSLY